MEAIEMAGHRNGRAKTNDRNVHRINGCRKFVYTVNNSDCIAFRNLSNGREKDRDEDMIYT